MVKLRKQKNLFVGLVLLLVMSLATPAMATGQLVEPAYDEAMVNDNGLVDGEENVEKEVEEESSIESNDEAGEGDTVVNETEEEPVDANEETIDKNEETDEELVELEVNDELYGNMVVTSSYLASIDDTIVLPKGFSEDGIITQQEAVAFLLQFAGMKVSQLGNYPDDYNAMADSIGLTEGIDYVPADPCTMDEFKTMLENVEVLYEALHAEKMEPLFVNGMAQPIFDFDEVIRFCVYVESNYDTDNDGKLDLVKTVVQLPGAVLDGMKVGTIFEARPYIAGTVSRGYLEENMGKDGYDTNKMYAQPSARTPMGEATTEEAVDMCDPTHYNFYEDFDWYDYYLVRGFAVVESAGIGTLDSEGFETCGSDLEIDAFKCIIEWLTGDRVAYTNKTDNIEIKADWSNGNVGMTGRSYAGTTQFGLATTGVEGLKTIVPVAGIASWYEYTNSQGISTSRNVAYTETLAWYCNSRFFDQTDYATIAKDYGNYLYQLRIDQQKANGDYSDHWENRDYTLDYENIQCSALIVHGVNDDNVRTKQSDLMYQAYKKANQEVKLLLHQGAHMTPTYPSARTEMYIGDKLYDEVLNKWFSHYLYDVDNGIENMPDVISQSNLDGEFYNYDSWETDSYLTMAVNGLTDEDTTTINSDHKGNGITNWREQFTSGSTPSSSMYVLDIPEDLTIKGTIEVNIRAAVENMVAPAASPQQYSMEDANDEARYNSSNTEFLDNDNYVDPSRMNNANTKSEINPFALNSADGGFENRDALMMSAMIVDLSDETFKAYNTYGSQVPNTVLKAKGAWMGGGLENYDLVEFAPSNVNYKIVARGWMDVFNPEAGYDSKSAEKRTDIKEGEFNNYKLYLQPNLYTVEEGHDLALVIYTYEPGRASYAQNYQITIDNNATYASIPLDEALSDNFVVNYSSTEGGEVTSSHVSGKFVEGGETVTMTATPMKGYKFSGWIVNGKAGGNENPGSFIITQDTEITANFEKYEGSGGSSGGSSSGAGSINGGTKPKDEVKLELPSNDQFSDIQGHWAQKEISFVVSKGILRGTGENEFSPNLSMTRGMFVTALSRLSGDDLGRYNASNFSDVAKDAYYMQSVQWAVDKQIVSGIGGDAFGPEQSITREQMSVIMYNYAKAMGIKLPINNGEHTFADDMQISPWAQEAVKAMQQAGILGGKNGNVFDPQGTATRAEVSAVIKRLVEAVE